MLQRMLRAIGSWMYAMASSLEAFRREWRTWRPVAGEELECGYCGGEHYISDCWRLEGQSALRKRY